MHSPRGGLPARRDDAASERVGRARHGHRHRQGARRELGSSEDGRLPHGGGRCGGGAAGCGAAHHRRVGHARGAGVLPRRRATRAADRRQRSGGQRPAL
eukprot:3787070-Prymnesium_polylepis.1